jgi:hypothetical protein
MIVVIARAQYRFGQTVSRALQRNCVARRNIIFIGIHALVWCFFGFAKHAPLEAEVVIELLWRRFGKNGGCAMRLELSTVAGPSRLHELKVELYFEEGAERAAIGIIQPIILGAASDFSGLRLVRSTIQRGVGS